MTLHMHGAGTLLLDSKQPAMQDFTFQARSGLLR